MNNTIHTVPVSLEGWHEEQAAWNNRSDFFVNMHTRDDRKLQVVEFMDFLKKHNLFPKAGGRTLDVGCGVGDYALGLAKAGYKATGIDLSDGMIKGAKQLADAAAVPLDLYIGPWSEATRTELNWDKTFDLSYSIFCPVMFDPQNIEALHKTSSNHCLWIGFCERTDETVDYLTNHFYGEDGFPWAGKMQDCLDTIHRIGRNVEVVYKTVPETEVLTLEKAVEYFTMRLHNAGWGTMEDMKEEIRALLEPRLVDGEIHNKTVDKVAWVYWSVM